MQRLVRDAFARAAARPRRKLTLVHKHNVLMHAGGLWRRAVDQIATEYPAVAVDYLHVDAACIFLVTEPSRFDVIVTDNLFGDIITDLAGAITGGVGLAASGNINPTRTAPIMFEPVHGSAPDIAGQQSRPDRDHLVRGHALEHLGLGAEAVRVEQAVADDLLERQGLWAARTTVEVGDDIAELVSRLTPAVRCARRGRHLATVDTSATRKYPT